VKTFKALFRAPTPEAMAADQEALRRGEHLIVTCFLSGPRPYPKGLRQGELELTQEETRWRAFWLPWRAPLVIDAPVRSVDVRAAGQSDWNLKKGGKAFGLIPIPEFKVIEATTDDGVLELAVTSWDVPLVVFALRGDN
jgi:hypothetical protein